VNGFSPVWLSGLVGAIAGAVTALAAQFLGHRLAAKRELLRFQIQSFERFRREFTEDENLRAISIKKQPLTADEIDDYLGFFEEVGLYFDRGLVDVWNWSMRFWATQSSMRGKMSICEGRSDPSGALKTIPRIFDILSNSRSI
jgi:hypothetical protein